MLNDFFDWLQYGWGAERTVDGASYSNLLEGSLNFWGILEGTHLLTLMLFFGSILIVDLRLLGLAFRDYRVSTIEERLLPLTIVGFVIVILTGAVLFFAKAEAYWHNLMFRTKIVLLAVAIVNVAVFHKLVQNNQAAWDTAPSPPPKAKAAAIASLTLWVLIMASGRFIAYNWWQCGAPQPDWVNAAQACAQSRAGAVNLNDEFLGSSL